VHVIGRAHIHSIQPKRPSDIALDQIREAFARHPLKYFANEEAVRQSVVARSLARWMDRLSLLDRLHHIIPVEHSIRVVDHLANVVETRLVGHHLS